jgi:ketosteroid isomerase-like protein
MYSWLVRRVLGVALARLNAGDVRLIVWAMAPDAVFVFPGQSSFSGEHRGTDAISAWFRRFVALRPNYQLLDLTVAGPPWNMRIGAHFRDTIPIPGGGLYRNEGMEYGRIRWGRLTELRVYLDTERVAELDAALEASPPMRQRKT